MSGLAYPCLHTMPWRKHDEDVVQHVKNTNNKHTIAKNHHTIII